jgi:hypothetical protein
MVNKKRTVTAQKERELVREALQNYLSTAKQMAEHGEPWDKDDLADLRAVISKLAAKKATKHTAVAKSATLTLSVDQLFMVREAVDRQVEDLTDYIDHLTEADGAAEREAAVNQLTGWELLQQQLL